MAGLVDEKGQYIDPFVYENGVLVNCFGITTTAELNTIEKMLTALRLFNIMDHVKSRELVLPEGSALAELAQLKQLGFQLSLFVWIHNYLFRDVYPWAGVIRTIDIEKGKDRFVSHSEIVPRFFLLSQKINKDNYQIGRETKEQFAARLAYYLAELNKLHPFREGNGRTQRVFCSLLAINAGYHMDWMPIGNEAMVEACKEAFEEKYRKLERLIFLNLTALPN